jgi:hypothetical protein
MKNADMQQGRELIKQWQISYWLQLVHRTWPLLIPLLMPPTQLRLEHPGLFVTTKNSDIARKIYQQLDKLALLLLREGLQFVVIEFPQCRKAYHFELSDFFQVNERRIMSSGSSQLLLNADYQTICEKLKEWKDQGLLVVITSQISSRCLHVNDLMSTGRGTYFIPSQWIGVNFLDLWRDSMDDYRRLREFLDRDGHIPGFTYRLLRPDGSMGEYEKDYYLCNNYLGEPVRISVAKPGKWRIVQPAPEPLIVTP